MRTKRKKPNSVRKLKICIDPKKSEINPPIKGPIKGPMAIIVDIYPNIMVALLPE